MADDDLSQDSPQHEEDLPDRLRVHSLARVLGTTSRRVLDALSELDGRSRSAHSSVDKTDAVRVREVLAGSADTGVVSQDDFSLTGDISNGAHATPLAAADGGANPSALPVAERAVSDVPQEPQSRLMLEGPADEAVNPADYLPLFVAPQPVTVRPVPVAADEADVELDDVADEDLDDGPADTDAADPDRPANRRRRRGRRGRGRGRGDQGGSDEDESGSEDDPSNPDESTDDADDVDADDADDDGADDDNATPEGATRRRRRRKRRKSGTGADGESSGSADDPPNTVVHERPQRSSTKDKDAGEIQGISGSTRLEAKRQRRRDGRDAGRRRPPILSEAEFLARREAVERVMVVRDRMRTEPPHEGSRYTQIAVLEDGVVVEHFVTSAASASLVGNIYLGIVQNVLPSMEAAFVDIGRGRNGVLYAGEVNWEAAGLGGASRKIEQALKPGDYVVVQVSKDPVGHKGARLTTQISLAGRYLVYVPGASSTGISRKLPDTERQRLKEILREVVPPNAGVIIRTASEGVKEDDIRSDVTRLQERWTEIETQAAQTKANAAGAAVALYEEPDVLVKVIRDLFNEDFSGLIVSGDDAWVTINDYVNSVAPELVRRLTKYEVAPGDGPDVFAVYRIDEQLAKAMDRKVWLPSGGTLVIDRTEAMTVVDVNTGKFTGAGGNLEQTVTRNNLEAAEEVVRQLRLRDIGGIVVIDFIDMVLESNRDLVLRRLTEALARDRTRHQVSEVTSLGLVQLTRKKLGTGLVEAFSTTCPHCAGRGIVLHADPIDSAQAMGRAGRTETGTSRRGGKRAKRSRGDEPVEAKAPAHNPAEHPMFKAMAAANGHLEDGEETGDDDGLDDAYASTDDFNDSEEKVVQQVVAEADDDDDDDDDDPDIEDDDIEDIDDADAVDDEDDGDDEDDPDIEDDDIEDIDDAGEDDDDDDDDEDEDEDDIEVIGEVVAESDKPADDDDDDFLGMHHSGSDDQAVAVAVTAGRPRRRRAAARPAGPPVSDY